MFSQRGNLNTSRHFHARSPRAEGLSALLLNIIDGALAAVIFLLPYVMGGRHPLGQLMLAALAVIAGLAWAVRQTIRPQPVWRPTWALALISAGVILVALQAIPLPQTVLEILAKPGEHPAPVEYRTSGRRILGPLVHDLLRSGRDCAGTLCC